MELLTTALLFVFPAVMIGAALRDITTMTIPNWMSAVLVVGFFPAGLAAGLAPSDLLMHLGAGFAVLAVTIGMFAMGWMGGGDAKILGAASLWLGFAGVGPFLLWTALAGGALTLALIQARRLAPSYAAGPAWVGRLLTPKGYVPYGVAIATGALATFPTSALVQRFAGGF